MIPYWTLLFLVWGHTNTLGEMGRAVLALGVSRSSRFLIQVSETYKGPAEIHLYGWLDWFLASAGRGIDEASKLSLGREQNSLQALNPTRYQPPEFAAVLLILAHLSHKVYTTEIFPELATPTLFKCPRC
jgi:hypothetical protein